MRPRRGGAKAPAELPGAAADCPAPGAEVQTFDAGVRTKEAFYRRGASKP